MPEVDLTEASISITRVEVEKLFGKYTYTLPDTECALEKYSSLFIIYGDNGCGKTTVLKLLFHILSPSRKRKHRTFIAGVQFKSFSVFLADGTHITARRENESLTGDYQLFLQKRDKIIATARYQYDIEKKRVTGDDLAFISELQELQLVLFFLGDNRTLDNDLFEDEPPRSKPTTLEAYQAYLEREIDLSFFSRLKETHGNIELDSALTLSIERTKDWVRQQALKASNVGAANVHSIYEGIIERIINNFGQTAKDSSLVASDNQIEELIEEIKAQEQRSQDFSRFGLISPPSKTEKLVNMLQDVDEGNKSVVWHILKPYLDSVAARLNALQETQDILTVFVNTINDFLRDKKIQINVRDGLKVFIDSTREIPPSKLSSGEKQLLLLLCNTLTAHEKATIFIIDEPEISLNIKWQRNLIKALLDCTKGSQVQFLLATHSLELLSQYRSHVVKLESKPDENENGNL